MKKIKEILIKLNNWKFIIMIILIIGGGFYWFQIRPNKIYVKCNEESRNKLNELTKKNGLETINEMKSFYDTTYNMCIRSKGINN